MAAAVQPGGVELVGVELGRNAAVGGHRARAVGGDERDDRAGPALDDGTANVDSIRLETVPGDPTRLVVRPLADEARLPAQLGHPRGDVRRLASGAQLRRRVGVGARREGLAQADDHVEEQVAERDDHA